MKKFAIASIAASVAAALAGSASAAAIGFDSYTNATPPADTRANGSATDSAVTIDGTNSTVKIVTTDGVDGAEKAAPFFYAGTLGTAIGTLGDLGRGGLTADWLLESRGANTPSFVGNIAGLSPARRRADRWQQSRDRLGNGLPVPRAHVRRGHQLRQR
jgi:hypothetical protein